MRTLPACGLLMLSVALQAAPQSAIASGFTDVKITVNVSGGANSEEDQANNLPSELTVSAHGTASWDPSGGYSCGAQGWGSASVVGNDRMIIADLSISGSASGNQRCFNLGWGPLGSSATTTVNARSSEPVYLTRGFPASGGVAGVENPFEQVELTRSADGRLEHALNAQTTSVQLHGYSGAVIGVWSVGRPGSAELPFIPFLSAEVQRFVAPVPDSSAEESGPWYFAPVVDPNYLIKGFDLSGADGNRFSAFRFPDVPDESDNRFTLVAGSFELSGVAGQTINLLQYASEGFGALSLRGDLTPFLMAAAVTGAATPIGATPQQLAFGLSFAQAGIARFTLKPVPEPTGICLGVAGVVLLAAAKRTVSGREMVDAQ